MIRVIVLGYVLTLCPAVMLQCSLQGKSLLKCRLCTLVRYFIWSFWSQRQFQLVFCTNLRPSYTVNIQPNLSQTLIWKFEAYVQVTERELKFPLFVKFFGSENVSRASITTAVSFISFSHLMSLTVDLFPFSLLLPSSFPFCRRETKVQVSVSFFFHHLSLWSCQRILTSVCRPAAAPKIPDGEKVDFDVSCLRHHIVFAVKGLLHFKSSLK